MRGVLRIGVALVAGLVSLAGSELLLRAAGYQYSPLQLGAGVKDDWRDDHAFGDRHLVYDPLLIWRPRSGSFSPFNPQGFRGAPVDPVKAPGARRLVALGDSNTFGWDVDDGANWPSQLQQRLAASHPGAEVLNAGVWGYSSFQGRRRFEEIVAVHPDIVLVSFGANDAHQVTVPDAEYVARHERVQRLTQASKRFRLAQLSVAALDRVESLAAAGAALGPRVPLDEYTGHLTAMVRSGRQQGIRVVLLTRPFVGSSTDPTSWKAHAPAYNAATIAVGRSEHAPVIDLYDAFRDHPELFDDESHFGVEGHRRAADLIHARLADLLAAGS